MEVDLSKVNIGSKEWPITELFDYFYGKEISPDATPWDIRNRIIWLTTRYHEALFEKTLSKRKYGRKEVDIWNSILDLIKTTMRSIETVNMSVCNEAKFIAYER